MKNDHYRIENLAEVYPMLNTRLILMSVALILLIPFTQVHAARTAPQILDGSIDEGARYFSVHCPDGKRTAIRAYFEEYQQFNRGEICYKDQGKDMCSKGGTLDDAAVRACKAM